VCPRARPRQPTSLQTIPFFQQKSSSSLGLVFAFTSSSSISRDLGNRTVSSLESSVAVRTGLRQIPRLSQWVPGESDASCVACLGVER
jgi:hypothetical protein